jgi:hypothetical protein
MDAPVRARGGGRQEGSQDGTCRLLEYVASDAALKIDREHGIVRDVKVLGLVSANGRVYLKEGLAQALRLYERRPVNIDHAPADRRSYRDRIGLLQNCRLAEDGIRADLIINPRHPLAEQVLWDAEHAPTNLGLSHDATGRTTWKDGKQIVEAITAVRSVDLVAEPATTQSLFEDRQPQTGDDDMSDTLAALTLQQLQEARPDLVQQVVEASQLRAKLSDLEKERDALRQKLAQIEAREALLESLRTAGIRAEDVPASWMRLLESADAQARQEAISELAQLLAKQRSSPATSGPVASRATVPDFVDRVRAWRVTTN